MSISTEKKNLIKKAKELGVNVNDDMSIFDIEKAINEANPPKEPKKQPSSRRGEY